MAEARYSKNVSIDKPKTYFRKPEPTLVRGILGKTFEKYGIDRDIARYQFVLFWDKIVGAAAAARAQPECLRGRTLIVRVKSSAWAQELSFQKATILEKLRLYSTHAPVDDVKFYVG